MLIIRVARKTKVILVPGIVLLAVCVNAKSDEPWVRHSTFEDFATGRLEDGGTNLFISREGTLQMIHRWDFNNDGYLDLWVGQDHDVVENADVFIYRGSPTGPESILPPLTDHQPLARLLREIESRRQEVTRLPSDGGGQSLVTDLNNDGHPDLVFCNYIHNYSVYMKAIIYWGSTRGYEPERRTELPTLMAGGLAVADFDQDGFVDLAFANKGIEGGERFGFDKHLQSYVYWNSPTGFSGNNRTSLPTTSAADCAAADLNGDGYPELLFANNNSQHQSLSLYWGSPDGFSEDHRDVWTGGDPAGLHLEDFNGDDFTDLIVMHGDDRAELWRGTEEGPKRWENLPTLGATDCDVSDLNQDGHPDLVFANHGTDTAQVSYIYWGAADGFSGDRQTQLPTLHASGVCLADFNSDGWIDIVFANEHDGHTYDVSSYCYWNSPNGFDPVFRSEFQGFGAVSASSADVDSDGHPELALVNRHSGSIDHSHSFVYWGNPRHHYSQTSMTEIPGRSDASAIADLNQDNFVDIVFPSGVIFWGSTEGFSEKRRYSIDQIKGTGVSIADLNRDGYLDLVFVKGEPLHGEGLIFWGGATGYDTLRRTTLKLKTHLSLSMRIADFNKDGFLDIVFGDVDSTNVDIFWGTSSGDFHDNSRTNLRLNNGATIEIADLNHDQWLDLILGGGWDETRFGRPTREAMIVWGDPSGFSPNHVLRLEAFDSLEQAVADLNRDGYLDIVMTNYHAYTTRTIPVFIYWGSPDGRFRKSLRSSLPAESSSALTVADLNQDSWMDIVAFNHIRDGDHGTGSSIYWGSRTGYSSSRRHWFQTFGPHFSTRRDIGNIYDRSLEERYVSAPLQCPADRTPTRLKWQARTTHGTSVRFQIRAAATRENLKKATWRGVTGSQDWFDESGAVLPDLTDDCRWLQYRVALQTPDGGSTPVLEEVVIDVK